MAERWLSVEEIVAHPGVTRETICGWIAREQMSTQRIIETRRHAEFTEINQIETDFAAKVESEFNTLIAQANQL